MLMNFLMFFVFSEMSLWRICFAKLSILVYILLMQRTARPSAWILIFCSFRATLLKSSWLKNPLFRYKFSILFKKASCFNWSYSACFLISFNFLFLFSMSSFEISSNCIFGSSMNWDYDAICFCLSASSLLNLNSFGSSMITDWAMKSGLVPRVC